MTYNLPLASLLPEAAYCSECRTRLERLISSVAGVRSASVGKETLHVEAERDLRPELPALVASLTCQRTHATFRVSGMDCASCAVTVEGALSRLPGVSGYRLNPSSEKLELTFDPEQVGPDEVAQALEPLGYGLEPLTQDEPRAEREAPWHRSPSARAALVVGALLALAFGFGLVAPAFSSWGYAVAALVGGWPFAQKAWRMARVGNPFSINTLMTVAAVGAVFIGEASEAAIVVFLFAMGEWLEGVAAGRARAGIRALTALTPKTALLLENGASREVAASSLRIGQVLRVQPGGRVPADGIILTGESQLNDAPVTGESVPLEKGPGESVYAGSINGDGALTVRVDKNAQDNTIARIIRMVEEAQERKAPTQRFIDRFSRFYTPAVLLVSLLVVMVPPLLFGGSWGEWLYKGLALLLIGCPCALLISTPAAITSGIAAGARRGLLIKGGAALESLAGVKTVAFDKTGTLTEGKPVVTDLLPLGVSEDELLSLAAAVEVGSSHPLAHAILAKTEARGLELPDSSEHKTLGGQGATAIVAERSYAVVSPRYAAEFVSASESFADLKDEIAGLEQQGKTVVVLLKEEAPLGLIALRDEARADAKDTVAGLAKLGVRAVMLTGDNARTGAAIGQSLGLEVRAELMPEAKLDVIEALKRTGKVAMVGDGINDAPALAAADVGVAMGGGTEVALETADAALLRERVVGVLELLHLSRATMSNIRQNITVALALKALFLVTTLLGLTNLWMAILADTGATVLVTANALRLLGFRGRRGG